MNSQNAYVLSQLMEKGSISRNHCLDRRITRLAARIADLKFAGHQIVGRREKTQAGNDYVYTFEVV